jgi:hypothetical protein
MGNKDDIDLIMKTGDQLGIGTDPVAREPEEDDRSFFRRSLSQYTGDGAREVPNFGDDLVPTPEKVSKPSPSKDSAYALPPEEADPELPKPITPELQEVADSHKANISESFAKYPEMVPYLMEDVQSIYEGVPPEDGDSIEVQRSESGRPLNVYLLRKGETERPALPDTPEEEEITTEATPENPAPTSDPQPVAEEGQAPQPVEAKVKPKSKKPKGKSNKKPKLKLKEEKGFVDPTDRLKGPVHKGDGDL